jgi:hypothetical protein
MDSAILFGVSKQAALAGLTGLFIGLALLAFLRTSRGKRLPYIWAWVIRVALTVVALVSQMAGGATYSLALTASQVLVGLVIVVVVARRQPVLGRLDRMDWLGICLAAGGVVLWLASGNPLYGLLGVIVADCSATAMGIRANIRKGSQESVGFWACALLAAVAATLAAGNASLTVLLAPLFGCVNALANIATVLLVRLRRQRVRLATEAKTA